MDWTKWIVLFTGAVVGFLSGMLGKGGSAITTPALQVFARINPFSALASPLPVSLPTTLSASFAYRGKQLLDTRVIALSATFGIPATLAGSFFSSAVKGHVLMLCTALFVLAIGLSFFIWNAEAGESIEDRRIAFWKIIVVASGVGFLSGLLANSGGVLFGPLFIRFLKMPVKKALACSLVVSALLAIPGTLAHWYLGHIDWMIAGLLSVGSIPFSYLGARLALKMHHEWLEKVFAAVLILFGAFDFYYSLQSFYHP